MIYENAYLQALYDFESNEPNEISFKAGDILKANYRVNQDWFNGTVVSEENAPSGNFPLSFVNVIDVPVDIKATYEYIWVATTNFPKLEQRDLDFLKGQLIIGKKLLDENWCFGCYLTNEAKNGMFPLTHVKKVFLRDQTDLQQPSSSEQNQWSNRKQIVSIRNARVIKQFNETNDSVQYLRLDYGDYVLVTHELDSIWLLGENINGQKGIFPRDCVELMDFNDHGNLHGTTKLLNRTQRQTFMSFDDEEPTRVNENIPEHDYCAIENEDNPALTDDQATLTLTNQQRQEEANGPEIELVDNRLGLALHDFIPENANELRLFKDDRLVINGEVEDWYNACNSNGHIGLVPKSYVQLIVKPHINKPTFSNFTNHQQQKDYKSQQRKSYPCIEHNANEDAEQNKRLSLIRTQTQQSKFVEILKTPVKIDQTVLINRLGTLRATTSHTAYKQYEDHKSNEYKANFTVEKPICRLASKTDDQMSQRRKIISELVDTEKIFQAQMRSVYQCFASAKHTTTIPYGFDGSSLFGNLDEIIKVSSVLTTEFDRELDKKEHFLKIGKCLLNCADSMKTEYGQYCENHPRISETIERYESDLPISIFIKTKLKMINESSLKNLNLHSILIKPVQRITKYSLFIDQLIKNTPDKHCDHVDLVEASRVFKEILLFINENDQLKSKNQKTNNYTNNVQSVSYKDLLKKFSEIPTEKPKDRAKSNVEPTVVVHHPEQPSTTKSRVQNQTNQLFSAENNISNDTVKLRPSLPPKPRPPPKPTLSSLTTIPTTQNKSKFVEDLTNRIRQLADLISIQEEVNELFLSRNELVIIENEPSQLNQEKLNYLKNEKSKLEEILLKMETVNELEHILTEDSTLQSGEIVRTDSDSPENEPDIHSYETQKRNSRVSSVICSSIRKAPVHVSDDDEKKTNDDKKQYTRLMTIDELITTEKNYYSQMNAVHQVFFDDKNSSPNLDFDRAIVFGNLDEIIHLSAQFISLLEQEVVKPEDSVKIGACLLNFAGDMQQFYTLYCQNHDRSFEHIKKYENIGNTSDFIKTMLKQISEDDLKGLNLQSIIIKPVQRITKYSLFIDQLIKNTPDTHCDHADLIEASRVFKQVLVHINEYKRRKDLILKYTKDEQKRISLNAINKKVNRLGMKFTSLLGLYDQTTDLQFSKEEESFQNIEKNAKNLAKEISFYTTVLYENLENQMNMACTLVELYKDYDEQMTVFTILHKFLEQTIKQDYAHFMKEINLQVLIPLNKLLKFFELPNKLIEKRFNKLLDYDKVRVEFEKNKQNDQNKTTILPDMNSKRLDYEALNAQLLEELPILINRSTLIISKCSKTFLSLFVGLFDQLVRGLNELKKNQTIAKSISVAKFDKSHLDGIYALDSFFSNKLKPINVECQRLSLVIDTETKLETMKNKYASDKLYRVKQFCEKDEKSCVLGACTGDIVAVLKTSDPSGRQDFWFVDNGDGKGLLPSNILVKLETPNEVEQNHSLIDFEIKDELKTDKKENSNCSESCIALYDFDAKMSNMLQMKTGEVFLVVERFDKKGDKQWFLLENEHGIRGYVPSNYILILE